GARNETRPARKATGIDAQLTSSLVEARELVIDETLEPGVELLLGLLDLRLTTAPRPDEEPGDDGTADDGREREQPGEKPETAPGRLREHLRPELGDQRILDLLLAVAGRDACADDRLHALRDRGVRLVERRLADRADEL